MILSPFLQCTDSDMSAAFRGFERGEDIPLALLGLHVCMCSRIYLQVRMWKRSVGWIGASNCEKRFCRATRMKVYFYLRVDLKIQHMCRNSASNDLKTSRPLWDNAELWFQQCSNTEKSTFSQHSNGFQLVALVIYAVFIRPKLSGQDVCVILCLNSGQLSLSSALTRDSGSLSSLLPWVNSSGSEQNARLFLRSVFGTYGDCANPSLQPVFGLSVLGCCRNMADSVKENKLLL